MLTQSQKKQNVHWLELERKNALLATKGLDLHRNKPPQQFLAELLRINAFLHPVVCDPRQQNYWTSQQLLWMAVVKLKPCSSDQLQRSNWRSNLPIISQCLPSLWMNTRVLARAS
jgi:hypothetical protein